MLPLVELSTGDSSIVYISIVKYSIVVKSACPGAKALLSTASPVVPAGAVCYGANPMTYDILIRGGLVFDGSGAAGVRGDVAIQSRRIAAIGPNPAGGAAKLI